jgi:hypothetical protein
MKLSLYNSFPFLTKEKYDEGISSGSMGVEYSTFTTSEPSILELVARGVKYGMGDTSAVDYP